jgi:hypothetical protein
MKLMCNLAGILLLSALSLPMVYSQPLKPAGNHAISKSRIVTPVAQQKQQEAGQLIEEFSFLIKDFKVDHQGEANTLNISISYRYVSGIANSNYPDFRLLARDVEALLTNYPNEKDYWEIVNKNVTSLLMKKYPALTSINCEIKADPTPQDPYIRFSRVIRERPLVRSNRKRS